MPLTVIDRIRKSGLPTVDQRILIEVVLFGTGDEGVCTAAVETIAANCGCSERTARRSIHKLTGTWLEVVAPATRRSAVTYRVRVQGGQAVHGTPVRGDNRGDNRGDTLAPDQGDQGDQGTCRRGVTESPQPSHLVIGAKEGDDETEFAVCRLRVLQESKAEGRYPWSQKDETLVRRALSKGRTEAELVALLEFFESEGSWALSWRSVLGDNERQVRLRAKFDGLQKQTAAIHHAYRGPLSPEEDAAAMARAEEDHWAYMATQGWTAEQIEEMRYGRKAAK